MCFLQGFEFIQDVVFAFLHEFRLKLSFGDLEKGDVEKVVVFAADHGTGLAGGQHGGTFGGQDDQDFGVRDDLS